MTVEPGPLPGHGAPGGDGSHVRPAIEAILLVAESPLPPDLLGRLVGVSAGEAERVCADLAAEYVAQGRGFELRRVAGGYRYQTAEAQAPYVERFVLDGQSARLSAAALETLAIVAYKQPISRNQIAAIRGVNVDGVVRTLQQRGFVAEVARDPGPGQAVLYGTTPLFLERMGLDSIDELPPLGDFVPGADVVEALERGLRVDEGAGGSGEGAGGGAEGTRGSGDGGGEGAGGGAEGTRRSGDGGGEGAGGGAEGIGGDAVGG